MRDEEPHLSREKLSERLDVPVETIKQWDRKGIGPDYMRLGGHIRYRLADVIAWEKSRVVASAR